MNGIQIGIVSRLAAMLMMDLSFDISPQLSHHEAKVPPVVWGRIESAPRSLRRYWFSNRFEVAIKNVGQIRKVGIQHRQMVSGYGLD